MKRLLPVCLAAAPTLLVAACGDDTTSLLPDLGADTTSDTASDAATDPIDDATDDVAEVDAADGSGDATPEDTEPDTGEPTRVADLGIGCPMGCNLDLCADLDSDCEEVCLFDGRTGIDTYCSQPCDGTCPAGWECLEAEDDTGSFCFALPAVCGDGAQQFGEACDDGNTEGRDLCAADCSAVTTIPSWGTFSFGPPGGTPQTFDGEEPMVYGHLRDFGDRKALVLGVSNSQLSFGLEIADVTDLAPASGLSLQTSVAFFPCNFNGMGPGLTITEFDLEGQHIVGSYSSTIACWANCFDCGGDGNTRVYEGSFDIHFIDDPNMD